MRTRSAKAKGKRLEKWIRDIILKTYPELKDTDVRITIGVESGNDIKLSDTAKALFPFAVEAKNREVFKTIYSYLEQAANGAEDATRTPLAILKMNNKEPLALLDAKIFFGLLNTKKENND